MSRCNDQLCGQSRYDTYIFPCVNGEFVLTGGGNIPDPVTLTLPPASYVITQDGRAYVGPYAYNLGVNGQVGTKFENVILNRYYVYSKDNCRFLQDCSSMSGGADREVCGDLWGDPTIVCIREDRGVYVPDGLLILLAVVVIVIVMVILLAWWPEIRRKYEQEDEDGYYE